MVCRLHGVEGILKEKPFNDFPPSHWHTRPSFCGRWMSVLSSLIPRLTFPSFASSVVQLCMRMLSLDLSSVMFASENSTSLACRMYDHWSLRRCFQSSESAHGWLTVAVKGGEMSIRTGYYTLVCDCMYVRQKTKPYWKDIQHLRVRPWTAFEDVCSGKCIHLVVRVDTNAAANDREQSRFQTPAVSTVAFPRSSHSGAAT